MTRFSVLFSAPGRIELEESPRPRPTGQEVLVASEVSAISAGTELLVYRGQAPPVDSPAELPALRGKGGWPRKFGYSMVGRVSEVGPEVEPGWLGRRVFAFHPHESHFVACLEDLQPLPDGLEPERGVFLPNLETAVNFVHDGRPLLGERVLVTGQGIVGLLTVALLSRFPLAELVAVDPIPARRQAALRLGATASLAPEELDQTGPFDLTYEVSGQPAVLNLAIAATGFSGRVVIGSWYGTKQAALDLGSIQRNRIQLISSQVSTIDPLLTGAWSKSRRLHLALGWLDQVRPEELITHRFPVNQAARAFDLLDRTPEEAIQIVLTYP